MDSERSEHGGIVHISGDLIYLTGLREVTFNRILSVLRNHYKHAVYDF